MAGNSFGEIYRITTFGESHGPGIGVVIDGCPSGLTFNSSFIQSELNRRRPGQSSIVTQRKESESFEVLSGVFEGRTIGTPICIFIRNENQKSKDYDHIKDSYRPSHADFTYDAKYGIRDYRGGGRSSARETAARVIGGAIAKLILAEADIKIQAMVSQVGDISLPDGIIVDMDLVEQNEVRCPHPETATQMIDLIKSVRKDGDTIGGIVTCYIENCPRGLGEPVFDRLHADLGKAMMSINAAKGFEYGEGFNCVSMRGSQHNDSFVIEDDDPVTETNHAGGILGGISTGMDINFNVAFKPVATIMQDQKSINRQGEAITVKGKGRHDPCVVPRAVPIVEAMAAMVIVDHYLRDRSSRIDYLF